ncbi:MAG: hypothetical protein KKD18_06255 [Nanoarchaeota archaeon]|nr:hypothetical protein [Nanoarchaeota archaeon]
MKKTDLIWIQDIEKSLKIIALAMIFTECQAGIRTPEDVILEDLWEIDSLTPRKECKW